MPLTRPRNTAPSRPQPVRQPCPYIHQALGTATITQITRTEHLLRLRRFVTHHIHYLCGIDIIELQAIHQVKCDQWTEQSWGFTLEKLSTKLARYAVLYNQHIPQKALDHRAPIEAMKEWQHTHPELLVKRIRKLTGPDNYCLKSGVHFTLQCCPSWSKLFLL